MFKRIPLVLQLILLLIATLVLPCVVLMSVSSGAILSYSQKVIAENALAVVEESHKLNELYLKNVTQGLHRLAITELFQSYRNMQSYDNIKENVESGLRAQTLQKDLLAVKGYETGIYSAFFYLENSDYVISTDRGVVGLDDYPDISWLGDAADTRGAGGVWLPRRHSTAAAREIATGGKTQYYVNVLTYVYRLNKLTTSTRGVFAVSLDERQVCANLNQQGVPDPRYGVMLLSRDGTIISHPDESLLLSDASAAPNVGEILESGERSGYRYLSLDGEPMLYTFYQSSYFGWLYVSVQSMAALSQGADALNAQISVAAAAVILAGALLSVIVILWASKPMRLLVRTLRQSAQFSNVKDRNELSFLNSAFSQVQSQEKELVSMMIDIERDALSLIARAILSGDSVRPKDVELLEKECPNPVFVVAVIAVDRYGDYSQKTSMDFRAYNRLMLLSRAKELLPEGWRLHGARYGPGQTAAIVNMDSYSAESQAALGALLKKTQQIALELLGHSVTVGVSHAGHDCREVGELAAQAAGAVARRITKGGSAVIYAGEPSRASRKYFYPADSEKRLLAHLAAGDESGVARELDIIREAILMLGDGVSYDNIRFIYNQLLGASIQHLSERGRNIASVYMSRGNVYSAVSELDTVDEIGAYLGGFYRDIIGALADGAGAADEPASSLPQRIFAYLGEHFRESIVFEDMAAEIGVSYSYMRKVIRGETGRSMLDCINEMRIAEAKKLLRETAKSVSAIAGDVGYRNPQSMNRFFKKFGGQTANEYRQAQLGPRLAGQAHSSAPG
ncbi:MAG: AraC family transcriptional regulator [Clostridiales bacterium]|jgi:AraC-like DNA-binding protein|nr:AraC family transcriptional regulator [Clostridiales bacterium]